VQTGWQVRAMVRYNSRGSIGWLGEIEPKTAAHLFARPGAWDGRLAGGPGGADIGPAANGCQLRSPARHGHLWRGGADWRFDDDTGRDRRDRSCPDWPIGLGRCSIGSRGFRDGRYTPYVPLDSGRHRTTHAAACAANGPASHAAILTASQSSVLDDCDDHFFVLIILLSRPPRETAVVRSTLDRRSQLGHLYWQPHDDPLSARPS
jgi:hypothetical protein